MRLIPALLLTASLSVTATLAADAAPPNEELRVGRTNIFCVQLPCPWRGIAAADGARVAPADLMWSQQTLPPLAASSGDTDRIVKAWNNDQCLVINGRFVAGKLQVDHVVGECA